MGVGKRRWISVTLEIKSGGQNDLVGRGKGCGLDDLGYGLDEKCLVVTLTNVRVTEVVAGWGCPGLAMLHGTCL